MSHAPFAVLIPFAVPEECAGLGLGLAALCLGLVRSSTHALAVAQMFKEPEQVAVEAFIPYDAWKTIPGPSEHAPTLVITGSFEPPADLCSGALQVLCYEHKTGARAFEWTARIDAGETGASLMEAFATLVRALNEAAQRDLFQLDLLQLDHLTWEAMESVLLGERCELNDPRRGGPHDRVAALAHFERAVSEAVEALYPRERLATIARHTAMVSTHDKIDDAVLRTLTRALIDVPHDRALSDAALLLEVKRGAFAEALLRGEQAITGDRATAFTYALVAQVHRKREDWEENTRWLAEGTQHFAEHPALLLEAGETQMAQGNWQEASRLMRRALETSEAEGAAFFRLAEGALQHGDAATASWLVDWVLAWSGAHENYLQNAAKLALVLEPEGLHRASRLAKLGKALLARMPEDPQANLLTARSLAQMGERSEALQLLARVETLAPNSPWSAEATLGRFHLENPNEGAELEAVIRAISEVSATDLPTITIRAQRFSMVHDTLWLAHHALGLAEMRGGRFQAARSALEDALKLAPGCGPVRRDLTRCLLELREYAQALAIAKRGMELDDKDPAMVALAADAEHHRGNHAEAEALAARAVALDPNSETLKALVKRISERAPIRRSWIDALRSFGRA